MAARESTAHPTADESRRVAYRVLAQAGKRGRINDHLHRELARANLDSRQKSFVTEVVLGSTRMQGLLDAQLTGCYSGRYQHLENGVKALLRLGAYQIRFMDAVPDRAAVHTTVDLARGVSLDRAAGLINAVLRKLSQTVPPEPDIESGSAEALAASFSHPRWLVQKWLDQWDRSEVIELMEWNNLRPTVWLRVRDDPQSQSALETLAAGAGLTLEKHPQLPLYLAPRPSPAPLLESGPMDKGLFIVQDPSAGAVVAVVDPQPGETIIDLCAGPGGKTAALAEAVGPQGQVHAFEIDPGRIDMLNQTVNRLGLDNVKLYPGDALDQALPAADKILVDVPCTGTGVLARRADLRWKRQPEQLAELCSLQQKLLDHAASALAHPALLIYATCSLEPEENWDAVGEFQKRHPEVTLAPLPDHLPAAWIDANGALNTFPPSHRVDGVFAVRLSR